MAAVVCAVTTFGLLLSSMAYGQLVQYRLVWPISGSIGGDELTSPFGMRSLYNNGYYYDFHAGFDISTNLQALPVHNPDSATLHLRDVDPVSGNWFLTRMTQYEPDLWFIFAHLDTIFYQASTSVIRPQGTVLANAGETGSGAFGKHLHLGAEPVTVWSSDQRRRRNPIRYFPQVAWVDTLPGVFKVDTFYNGGWLNYVVVHVAVDGNFLDMNEFNVNVFNPFDSSRSDAAFSMEGLAAYVITNAGWNPIDTAVYSMAHDSTVELFDRSPYLNYGAQTTVSFTHRPFSKDSTYFVYEVKIDPWYSSFPEENFLGVTFKTIGKTGSWGNTTNSPKILLRAFSAESRDERVIIKYDLITSPEMIAFEIRRGTSFMSRQTPIHRVDFMLGAATKTIEDSVIDFPNQGVSEILYQGILIDSTGADHSVGSTRVTHQPQSFQLAQNAPNPFNSSTQISYSVTGMSPSNVTLNVFNVLGQRIRSLQNGPMVSGSYTKYWDGTDERGRRVGSGVYFYELRTQSFRACKSMVLLK